ncbi:MAG: YbbR-like domain-containing protein [Bacteroidales bacterium]
MKGKRVLSINRDVFIFAFFLLLSFVFWSLNSLGKEIESEVKYPVRYINLPKERVLTDGLPPRLDLYLKGPGYSILKLKLSGNRAPVILDISTINYRRVPGSRSLNYYILTSGLIANLSNKLRSEYQITSIKPDSLFFSFDRLISKTVPVIPDVDIQTERQYFVKGDIVVDPDSITVTGPEHIVDTIFEIKTKHKKFSGLNDTIKRSLNLKISKGVLASGKKIVLTIPVEQFTEAEIEVPVKIVNEPDSIDVKIFPDVVTVKALVAVSDYKKFEEIPFEVVLDLGKADLNSSDKIPVEFRNIPPFLNSLRVSPSKVDFLIERKVR